MSDVVRHVRAIADEFDRSFQAPRVERDTQRRPALAIRVGDDPYLLPLVGLSGISRAPLVVPLPGAPRAQLGIAGVRGVLVGVFSLAALLGYDPVPARVTWLVIAGGRRPVGLGFDVLDGQVTIGPTRDAASRGRGRHVFGPVLLDGETAPRSLLDLDSLVHQATAGVG